MLFRQRELRSRRHHRTRANVHEADVSLGRLRQFRRRFHNGCLRAGQAARLMRSHFRRRRNDVRFQRRLHHAVARKLHVGAGAITCVSGATIRDNEARVASSGTAGTMAPVATIFGKGTS